MDQIHLQQYHLIQMYKTHLNQLLEEIKTEQDKHANGRISIVLEVPTDVNERIIIIDLVLQVWTEKVYRRWCELEYGTHQSVKCGGTLGRMVE